MPALEWPVCLPLLLAAPFAGSYFNAVIMRLPEQHPA
jgi:hypothetical protein